jgi:hypothetical protein
MRAGSIKLSDLAGLRLGRNEKRALESMIRAYPHAVTHEQMIATLYGDNPQGGPVNTDDVVRITVRRLCRKLTPYGWTIPMGERGGRGVRAERRLAPLVS